MFTEKDLIAGETVLVSKYIPTNKKLYLGSAGLVHFVSNTNNFECANNNNFRIQELNQFYTIEQPESKVVPLELKSYDFVPVIFKVKEQEDWENGKLLAVVPNAKYPYIISYSGKDAPILVTCNYCEFLNEQL